MAKLTVRELLDLKGVRQIAFVQVASSEEAIAASAAGMDMIGTGFRPQTRDFPSLVPESHFQFGLAWGSHSSAQEALREVMRAIAPMHPVSRANRYITQMKWLAISLRQPGVFACRKTSLWPISSRNSQLSAVALK
jgi:hypothetical protein